METKPPKKKGPSVLLLTITLLTLLACKSHTYQFRSNYQDANSLLHDTENLQTKPFLKAHLKSGEVCILQDTWRVDEKLDVVTGSGSRYDFNRNLTYTGEITIPIDSVAIFETNEKLGNTESNRVRALSILAGLDVILGVVCITVPKACFGSCPTFYLKDTDDFHFADAEGFSNAISPVLEY